MCSTCVLYSSRWESLKSWNTWMCVFLTKKYPCCSVLPSSRGQYCPHFTRPRSTTLRDTVNPFSSHSQHINNVPSFVKILTLKFTSAIQTGVSPGGHYNDKYHLFPNHPPEVSKGFWQRTWGTQDDNNDTFYFILGVFQNTKAQLTQKSLKW